MFAKAKPAILYACQIVKSGLVIGIILYPIATKTINFGFLLNPNFFKKSPRRSCLFSLLSDKNVINQKRDTPTIWPQQSRRNQQ